MSKSIKLFWFQGEPCLILPSLLLTTLTICLGSSVLIGYSMGILNNMEMEVRKFLVKQDPNSTEFSRESNFQFAFMTSVYIVSSAIACFASGLISNYFGRRLTLMGNNIIAVLGGMIILLVMWSKSPINLYIGRFILGANAGISVGVAPLFLSEIAPTRIRGAIVACHQLSITFGIALAYLSTMRIVLDNIGKLAWVATMALPMFPATFSCCVLFCIHESPRYLLLMRHDDVAAIKACFWYNQTINTAEQIKEMRKEDNTVMENFNFRFWHLMTKKRYKIPIIVSIVINVMQQFSGINAIIGYSKSIILHTGVNELTVEYFVLGIGILNFISTIIGLPLLEHVGRRPILLWPSCICIITQIGLFLTIGILPQYLESPVAINTIGYISIGMLLVFIVGFAFGMGPIPSLIVTEMFTQTPRAAACSIMMGIQWTCSFCVLLCYPIINGYLPEGYVFIIFGVITLIAVIILFIWMPETKNQTFLEIRHNFDQKSSTATNVSIF